jgi:hypothetical protein
VKNQAYHFEIKDIITQFVSAFNNIVISRYDKNKSVVDKLQVRYLYSPKERVLYDIINKAQHITLPAVAVSITGVSRDQDRVFNKLIGSYNPTGSTLDESSNVSKFIPSPVPINIEVSMSMITRYQTDMDQLLSNFIPYANPYIIISWPVPDVFAGELQEIRTEVLWSGDVSLEYPTEINSSQPYRVTADTSFTIKGWLFPAKTQLDGQNILYIETNFTPVTGFEYI